MFCFPYFVYNDRQTLQGDPVHVADLSSCRQRFVCGTFQFTQKCIAAGARRDIAGLVLSSFAYSIPFRRDCRTGLHRLCL